MALPPLEPDCDISPDVCCDAFWGVANHLVVVVLDGLENCRPTEICDDDWFHGYVPHGIRVEDPAPNYVVASLANVSIVNSNQRTAQFFPRYLAVYQVRLLESGWPMAQDDGESIWVPDHRDLHALSRHSYSHGEVMWRALANAVATGNIQPRHCSFEQLGTFRPVEPSGGTVGWQVDVTVDVPLSSPGGL